MDRISKHRDLCLLKSDKRRFAVATVPVIAEHEVAGGVIIGGGNTDQHRVCAGFEERARSGCTGESYGFLTSPL